MHYIYITITYENNVGKPRVCIYVYLKNWSIWNVFLDFVYLIKSNGHIFIALSFFYSIYKCLTHCTLCYNIHINTAS